MLRKNRIFVIGKDNDGIEVVFGSKIISRNFSNEDYFDIIKEVFSLNQPNNEGEVITVGDRATKAEYVKNFDNKYRGHKAECTFFNYSDDGIPTQPKLRIFRFDLE